MRLDSIVKKNDRYRHVQQKEVELYEKLFRSLPGAQREEFENFPVKTLACERLAYQQGMKDLMVLLRSL